MTSTSVTLDEWKNTMRTAENADDLTRMVYRAIDGVLREQYPGKSPYATAVGVHLQLRRFDDYVELWWDVECPGALDILRRIAPVFERASGGAYNSSGSIKQPYGVYFDKTTSFFGVEPEYAQVRTQTIAALNQATTLESWYEALIDTLPSWYALQRGMPFNESVLHAYPSASEWLKRVHLPVWVERTQLWQGVPTLPKRSYGTTKDRIEKSLACILLKSCPLIEIHPACGFVELRAVPIREYSDAIQARCKPFAKAYGLLHDQGIPSWVMKNALVESSTPSLDISSLTGLANVLN